MYCVDFMSAGIYVGFLGELTLPEALRLARLKSRPGSWFAVPEADMAIIHRRDQRVERPSSEDPDVIVHARPDGIGHRISV